MGRIFFISFFSFLCRENKKENLAANYHITAAFIVNKHNTGTCNKLGQLFFSEES
jgi:hypothetical protein